jgi:hypothetical protein
MSTPEKRGRDSRRALDQKRQDAVRKGDFELASEISKDIANTEKRERDARRQNFLSTIDSSFQHDPSADADSTAEEQTISAIKREFEEAARVMARKHRAEAAALEQKWRLLYLRAERNLQDRVETSLISARTLADGESYGEAIRLREAANNIQRVELDECCNAFKKQHELLMRRHEEDYDHFHALLKNAIITTRQESSEEALAAQTGRVREAWEHTAAVIDDVLNSVTDPELQIAAIEHLSPRKGPSSGRAGMSPQKRGRGTARKNDKL